MNVKISGFADEICDELSGQVAGLQGLDMSYVEMRGVDGNNLIFHNDLKVGEIKKVLDANGISLSALGSPLGKIGITDDFAPHFEDFKRAVEIGHMMDCNRIRMFSFYLLKDCDHRDYESEVFERLGKFVEYAKANDAILLHENEKGIYGDRADTCRKLMDLFYGDNFKAIFDFANFVQCKQDTKEAYELLKPYIAYVHLKDAKWADGSVVPAGYGDGNVAFILNDLIGSGFTGFLSIEPHLFDFAGFASLEKNGAIGGGTEQKVLSGLEAFTLAHDSLMKILSGEKR